jgi:oligosaccharide repeat unit polymerase
MQVLTLAVASQIIVYATACLAISRIDRSWRRLYHPFVLVGGIYLAYSLGPLFLPDRLLLQATLERFEVVQLIGMLGLAGGAILAHARDRGLDQNQVDVDQPVVAAQGKWRLPLVVGAVTAFFLIAVRVFLGGVQKVLMEGYLTGSAETAGDTIILSLAYLLPVGVLGAAYLVYGARRSVIAGSAVFLAVNFMAGQRNIVLMLGSVLLACAAFRLRRMSYRRLAAWSAVGFVVFMLTGVYRQYGLRGIDVFWRVVQSDGASLLNPSSQELNTAFNVWSIYDAAADRDFSNLARGRSYLLGVVGVTPRILWPSRPLTVGQEFAIRFAGPSEGLGFSPNVEAIINFGLGGPIIVGGILSYLLVRLYRAGPVERRSLLALCGYAGLPFFAFNWNRIDFAVAFKMALLLALFMRLGLWMLSARFAARASPSLGGAVPLEGAPKSELAG